MKKILLVLFSISFLFNIVYAREGYRFRTFSPDGGFSYDGVTAIQQDSDGFIWTAIYNDLYRFDGYNHKSYSHYFKNINPNVRWNFNDINVDKQGRLLIATNNGLFLKNEVNSFEKILDAAALRVFKDARNNVWLTIGYKLHLLHSKDSLITPLHNGEPLNNINSFYSDNKYFFAASANGKVYSYDYNKGEFELVFKLPGNSYIRGIKLFANDIWILTSVGLRKVDVNTFTLVGQYNFIEKNVQTKVLHIDKEGFLWIGTQNGLYIYNPVTNEYNIYHNYNTDPFSLPNNSIWTIQEDYNQNVWIGTYSGGLCYVNIDERSRFKSYTSEETQLNHKLISGFAETGDSLWIATEGQGINLLNRKTQEFTYYKNERNNLNSISHNNIKSIVITPSNKLWIPTFTGGLNCYDINTQKFKHFSQQKDSILSNDLRKVILEADSGIWIAYQQNLLAVSFYSFKTETFSHYIHSPKVHAFIFDIIRHGNYLWIVTLEKIYRMDVKTKLMEELNLNLPFYLNAQTIVGNNNDIWIGTIDNGLLKYNMETKSTTVFNHILNLEASAIYSLSIDNNGYLWAGTDNGLFRYDIEKNVFFRYDKMDGIQGQVFYPLSAMKSKTGQLYFGGTNGFTIVDPSKIETNNIKPKVIISDFLVDHVSQYNKLEEKNLELNHNQINFGFIFSSNNYLMPEKNRFKYKLEGYDNNWVEVTANNRYAFYSKVPPGKYTFRVLSANNDGLWNEEPTSVTVNRLPAPWFSWSAYIAYALILAGILYAILKQYYKHKKLKLQVYLDQLELEKKEEIHQTQLSFFTNISHDFRTPLSLISAALEKLKQEGVKEYYYRILKSNSQRLLNLVNELMDFRTVENGKVKLNLQSSGINSFVQNIASDFKDYTTQKDIDFAINLDSSIPLSIPIDRQVMEKIIMNLINNSFKYTNNGGSISIKTLSHSSEFSSKYSNSFSIGNKTLDEPFSIIVSDTGIGISKESIESVFERFYKVNTVNFDSHLGTGIGLALVKSLVLLHKGSISIFSEREKGTDMIVSFSSNPNTYYKDGQAVNAVNPEEEKIYGSVKEIESIETAEDLLLRNKKRILFAEDNVDLRMLLADVLSLDYEVIEAPDGIVAAYILDKMEIDLIISDIMMPNKDGITFCKEVKEDVNTSHIPFILLTAKTGTHSKIEGTGSGADIYLEKPIDPNLLQLVIKNIFTQRQSLREYYSKNHFVDVSELSTNKQDNKFLKKFIEVISSNIDQTDLDVNYVASELSMSRSKLYSKIKKMTGKSIVEFILSYRLRIAAKLIVEENLSMREVMEQIGIESQSYFTRSFKKEFGETPTAFANKHKNQM